ncbi:MAG: hypothetical protein Q8R59_14150 [Polaromonas sp.]|nr:hypothetical protein [Polaromonas sp.]
MPLLFHWRAAVLAPLTLAACLAPAAHAQSSCSSDGQSRPVALLERFINADCRDCWSDAATPRVRRGQVALDWVLPGNRGEDAPLSAVASRDGLKRLQALGLAPPANSSSQTTAVTAQGSLRVAHGPPVAGYIGASVQLQRVPRAGLTPPFTAWLALVETLPAGTEASPVPRNLVRNLLQPIWDERKQLSKGERSGWLESRAMDIPAGTDPGRLALIGWVEDAGGRVFAAAQSRCTPAR